MAIQIISNYRKPNRKILQYPDDRLRQVSKEVINIDGSIQKIANKLTQVLRDIDKPFVPWLGMAAPQIGYNRRVIVIKEGLNKYLIMVNPEIVNQKWSFPAVSSCYSLKGLYLVKSPYWLKITYMDIKGNFHIEVFTGGQAILLKQEIDHLNGRLVCD